MFEKLKIFLFVGLIPPLIPGKRNEKSKKARETQEVSYQ